MEGICKRLVGKIRKDAVAISLIKGMEVKREGPCMISTLISEVLGISCCVPMGANIANEIAVEKFSEATVGYREDKEIAEKWVRIFNTPYFMVSTVQDVEGVELCGTLKNVVALAAGCNNEDWLERDEGLLKLLFPSVKDNTFFESCEWEEETGDVLMLLQGMEEKGPLMNLKRRCCKAKNCRYLSFECDYLPDIENAYTCSDAPQKYKGYYSRISFNSGENEACKNNISCIMQEQVHEHVMKISYIIVLRCLYSKGGLRGSTSSRMVRIISPFRNSS
ncbi:hypothetical protein K7X08_017563 [Anisodus acutangulus]|uniref:Glycerol-3-phosphate dehydrogenase NAD-dependent N-terminal domain-containing protein n=1 Tax=Anisodus acutangulus TaxID=402998 RepID=A0A9Q1R8B3_9SOLA|nr:hypothetical protein K7X08_017563 [Anisodus acutangulus]